MEVLGFSGEDQDSIFRILASILHLGNVYFEKYEVCGGPQDRLHRGWETCCFPCRGKLFVCLFCIFSALGTACP